MVKEIKPEVIKKSSEEMTAIIAAIEASNLAPSTKEFVMKCIGLACWLPGVLQKKNISLSRLRKILFGKGYKSSGRGEGGHSGGSPSGASGAGDPGGSNGSNTSNASNNDRSTNVASTEKTSSSQSSNRNGRLSHESYRHYSEVWVHLPNLKQGDLCPEGCGGRLYALPVGTVVRVDSQSLVAPTKYYLEKLRCNVCQTFISASLPKGAGSEKYTARLKAQLAMYRFMLGIPYYRLATYQSLLGVPLAKSTQWDLIESLAGYCLPIFNQLQMLVANGSLVFSDDTGVRILSVIKSLKSGAKGERTGMQTTCLLGHSSGHKIALYFNGTRHAGENLESVLAKRADGQGKLIHMCDALAANVTSTKDTLLCHCLSHGFRKVEELKDYFPRACLPILKDLAAVYQIDEQTRALSAEARLVHHQAYSKPILHRLYHRIESTLADKSTEPNGELAKMLTYFKRHWVKLTRFLSVAGAPLDNNSVEAALKLAIRSRKNALFYKTCYSASLSGVLLSLIKTCEFAGVEPVAYLTALQTYGPLVAASPEAWLPWCYHSALPEEFKATPVVGEEFVAAPAQEGSAHAAQSSA